MRRLLLLVLAAAFAAPAAQAQPLRFGFGLDASGLVQVVPPGSPAADGGLRLGDRVTAINGHDASGPLKRAMLPYLGALARTEQPAVLTVRRGDDEQTIRLTPARYAYPDPTDAQRHADARSAGVEVIDPDDDTRRAYRIAVDAVGTLIVDVPDVDPPTSGELVPPTLRAPDGTEPAPTVIVENRHSDNDSAPRRRTDAVAFRWRIDGAAVGDWVLETANRAAIQVGARLPAPLACAEVAWAWDASAPGVAEAFMGESVGGGFASYTPYLGPRLFGSEGRVASTQSAPAFAFEVQPPPPVGWGHVQLTGRFVSEFGWKQRARGSAERTRAAEVARCLAPYLEAKGEAPPELFDVFIGTEVRTSNGVVQVGGVGDGASRITLTFRNGVDGWAPACLSGDCQNGTGQAVVGRSEVYAGPFQDGEPHGEGASIAEGFRVRGVWADGDLARPLRVEAPNGARWIAEREGPPGEGTFYEACGDAEVGTFSPRWEGFRAAPCPSSQPTAEQLVADLAPILSAPDDFAPLRGAPDGDDVWTSRVPPASATRAFVVCTELMGPSCSHTVIYHLPSSDDAVGTAFLAADAFAATHPDWTLETTDALGFGLDMLGFLSPDTVRVSFVRCAGTPRRVAFAAGLTDPTLSVTVTAEAPGALLGIRCPR